MSRFARPARALALAALFAAAPALAQQSTPPSAEQLAAAKALLLDSGVGISVHYLIPRMMDSLATGVLRTRPELKDKLKATLTRLEPEFMKEEPSLFVAAATPLAQSMSLADLKATDAFFKSPVGQRYVLAQPAALNGMGAAVKAWQDKFGPVMLDRTRAEMKKQGADF